MSNATVPGPGGRPYGTPPTWPGGRTPSGLFPFRSIRPAYREPLPARPGAIFAGAGAAVGWMLVFGLLGHTAKSYCWWSIGAGLVAWLVALLLARAGDRGVAVGVAITSGVGFAIAMGVVTAYWIGGDWLLW